MATLNDVAQEAGVSASTASRALNRPDMVRPAVVERVRAAAEQSGYSPNPFARSLRLRGSKTLGLIIPDNTNPFFAEVARGIEAACFRAGYTLILCNSDRSLKKERAQAQVLRDKRVDGVLIFTVGDGSADTIVWLQEHTVPVVLVERPPAGLRVDCVVSDNAGGIRAALDHLAGLGHRRIGFLDGDLHAAHYADRLRAYQETIAALGLTAHADAVRDNLVSYADGQRAAEELLTVPGPPTALFCASDILAVGAIRGAALAGKRVPQDVAIVGFGDTELAAYTQPPLTSVVQEKVAVGSKAVRLLLRRIEQTRKGESGQVRTEVLATRLAVRASTGSPPGGAGRDGRVAPAEVEHPVAARS